MVTYGSTETGSGVVYDRVPLAGVDVDCDPETGELFLRGPMLLRCYRDGVDPRVIGPDGTAGWYPTGDAGHIDADGLVHIEGRLGERIRTGAETVWPARLDVCLSEHPAIAEVATWCRPDPEWGERVVAWIVPTDAAAPPSLDALREHVRATLPAWYAPKEIVLISELPRTASGKVRRHALR
jgi:O-succinylbenzoic acid--CoA ligase